MRRFPVTTLILIAVALAAIGGWKLFAQQEHDRYAAVNRVLHSQSIVNLDYEIVRSKGPIATEKWHMQNVNGVSLASYSVTDRGGTVAKFDEPITNYDVTFLFERLVQDGIWDLQTRPFRGKDLDVRSVRIEQTADTQSGRHQFEFSDPHYLATSAGREYHIHLDPNKPVPDILKLDSSATADDRYQKIVNDFEQFGSPRFKHTIAVAREKLLKS